VRKIEENMGKKMLFDTHFGCFFKNPSGGLNRDAFE